VISHSWNCPSQFISTTSAISYTK